MASPNSTELEASASFLKEHGRRTLPKSATIFEAFRRRKDEHVPTLMRLIHFLSLPLLVSLRLFVAIAATSFATLLVLLFGPTITKRTVQQFQCFPLSPWRRRCVRFATKVLGRCLLFSLGFWAIQEERDPNFNDDDARKATVISNHCSLADPCLLAYITAPAFVAKFAVWLIPGVGRVGAAQGAFYIDRIHKTSGISVTEELSKRQALAAKGDLPHVAIFPEGTTTNGRYLLKFKTGAFVSGKPVAPVLIRYTDRYFSSAYETIRTKEYICGLVTRLSGGLSYYRMPVYYPNADERNDARLFADNVHREMVETSKLVWGDANALLPSEADFVDKLEYHSIVRGTKLKKGLMLNMR